MASSSSLQYVTLDVFTQVKFEGNPLAVVKVPRSFSISQNQKQQIAREFNYSETTFIHEREDGQENHWKVDIFTKNEEISFAGHPTIGTACYALGSLSPSSTSGKFTIKAGPVSLTYQNNLASASIPHDVHIHTANLDLPQLHRLQPRLQTPNPTPNLPTNSPLVSIVNDMTFALIALPSLSVLSACTTGSELASVAVDDGWSPFRSLCYYYVQLPDSEDGTKNLRTRMIKGILEDPATGSAASALTSYLTLTGGYAEGQEVRYSVVQGVEIGRRSEIGVSVVMGGDGVREVVLKGGAVKVMEGRVDVG
ncbi:MAG: hypothetical protein M1820_004696 [Bogoriella megaspora]|nr:MAG: hypothetical protein M1820_004696 [Bogoriella megaspora]